MSQYAYIDCKQSDVLDCMPVLCLDELGRSVQVTTPNGNTMRIHKQYVSEEHPILGSDSQFTACERFHMEVEKLSASQSA